MAKGKEKGKMTAARRPSAAGGCFGSRENGAGKSLTYTYIIACACARFRACKQYYRFDTEDRKDGVPGEVFRQEEGVALRAIR